MATNGFERDIGARAHVGVMLELTFANRRRGPQPGGGNRPASLAAVWCSCATDAPAAP
jgi:hypothetical protein